MENKERSATPLVLRPEDQTAVGICTAKCGGVEPNLSARTENPAAYLIRCTSFSCS